MKMSSSYSREHKIHYKEVSYALLGIYNPVCLNITSVLYNYPSFVP